MDISTIVKSLSTVEMILLVGFIIFIVSPISIPSFLAGIFDSSLGMLMLFVIILFLFFYVNPILGVVFIFVSYEILRRSAQFTSRTTIMQHTPSQEKKNNQMKAMNPVKSESLEEEMVNKMAPVGHSDISVYTTSTFKPVADKVGSASLV
uniref:Uncharacterized protein n=1 Tax=viral metagenome TaxID=1070528 RepID=A0A6C0JHJ7_9ZZZZ